MTSELEAALKKAINDPRLSWRAKGIFAAFLFKKPDHTFNKSWIIGNGREGRDAATTAIRELKKFGYLDTRGIQEESTGQMIDNRFELKETETFINF